MRSFIELEMAMEKGIALLDSENPNWAKRIHAYSLDMESGYLCVLGKIYGSFTQGVAILGISFFEANEYGFNGRTSEEYEDYYDECRLLTIMWREEIQARQGF